MMNKLLLARALTAALLLLLFIGTLMPGSWKSAATPSLSLAIDLASVAHITLFAAICFMLPLARFWRVESWHVPVVGLGLALLTESLQFFAIDRHPNLAGVYQDMFGALIGWASSRRFMAAGAWGQAAVRATLPADAPANAGSIHVRGSPPSGT